MNVFINKVIDNINDQRVAAGILFSLIISDVVKYSALQFSAEFHCVFLLSLKSILYGYQRLLSNFVGDEYKLHHECEVVG